MLNHHHSDPNEKSQTQDPDFVRHRKLKKEKEYQDFEKLLLHRMLLENAPTIHPKIIKRSSLPSNKKNKNDQHRNSPETKTTDPVPKILIDKTRQLSPQQSLSAFPSSSGFVFHNNNNNNKNSSSVNHPQNQSGSFLPNFASSGSNVVGGESISAFASGEFPPPGDANDNNDHFYSVDQHHHSLFHSNGKSSKKNLREPVLLVCCGKRYRSASESKSVNNKKRSSNRIRRRSRSERDGQIHDQSFNANNNNNVESGDIGVNHRGSNNNKNNRSSSNGGSDSNIHDDDDEEEEEDDEVSSAETSSDVRDQRELAILMGTDSDSSEAEEDSNQDGDEDVNNNDVDSSDDGGDEVFSPKEERRRRKMEARFRISKRILDRKIKREVQTFVALPIIPASNNNSSNKYNNNINGTAFLKRRLGEASTFGPSFTAMNSATHVRNDRNNYFIQNNSSNENNFKPSAEAVGDDANFAGVVGAMHVNSGGASFQNSSNQIIDTEKNHQRNASSASSGNPFKMQHVQSHTRVFSDLGAQQQQNNQDVPVVHFLQHSSPRTEDVGSSAEMKRDSSTTFTQNGNNNSNENNFPQMQQRQPRNGNQNNKNGNNQVTLNQSTSQESGDDENDHHNDDDDEKNTSSPTFIAKAGSTLKCAVKRCLYMMMCSSSDDTHETVKLVVGPQYLLGEQRFAFFAPILALMDILFCILGCFGVEAIFSTKVSALGTVDFFALIFYVFIADVYAVAACSKPSLLKTTGSMIVLMPKLFFVLMDASTFFVMSVWVTLGMLILVSTAKSGISWQIVDVEIAKRSRNKKKD